MVRFVQLHTWWVSPGGKRQFCIVDKTGKHVDDPRAGGNATVYETTSVKLLEVLNPSPINYDVKDFWKLVDSGKLIEYIPGVTDLSKPEQASVQAPVAEVVETSPTEFEVD